MSGRGTGSHSGSRPASHRSTLPNIGAQRQSGERPQPSGHAQTTNESTASTSPSVSRFRTGFYRFIPFIGYHHVLMFLLLLPILFMFIAGCAEIGGIRSVHLASFSYRQHPPAYETDGSFMNESIQDVMLNWTVRSTDAVRVEAVRAGYLRICVKLEQIGWHCGIKGSTVPNVEVFDPLQLIQIGHHFRTQMVTCGQIIIYLILAVVTFVLLARFPGWREEEDPGGSMIDVRPFPSRKLTNIALITNGLGSIGLFISVAWQNIAVASVAAVVEGMRYDGVEVKMGVAAAVLSWLGVLIYALSLLGLTVMVLSITILSWM
ncbi:hypothetical protein AUP68_08084 [Ilyonectria robusta]